MNMKKLKKQQKSLVKWPFFIVIILTGVASCLIALLATVLVVRWPDIGATGNKMSPKVTYVSFKDKRPIGVAETWNPEIPVNEYWDYGVLDGLHLYVNNTDRNVVYALDDAGKIVWIINGQDYGWQGFQISMTENHLFIHNSASDEDLEVLRVFDANGRLAWQHTFYGYLDIPQMKIINGETVILENRASTTCNKGAGILAENQELSDNCTKHELWAFDLKTGNVLWVNNTGNFYGHYMSILPDGNISSNGGGWGGFNYHYVVASTTGEVLSFSAEFEKLVYNENDQTVSYIPKYQWYNPDANSADWTLPANNYLFQLIKKHLYDYDLKVRPAGKVLLLKEVLDDGSRLTRAVDVKIGEILWEKVLSQTDMDYYYLTANDNLVLLRMDYISQCSNECEACSGFICIDKNEEDDCIKCREDEINAPGFVRTRLLAINPVDGSILWHYDSKDAISTPTFDDSQVGVANITIYPEQSEQEYQYIQLDLKTGEVTDF